MLLVLLGCILLLGVLIGGAGMRRVGRLAGRAWRPGAGALALVAFLAAAVFGVMERFPAAVVLALVGAWLTVSIRRTRPVGQSPQRARDLAVEAAADTLGVSPDASDEEVQAAYMRLIKRVHPDAGGASGLAAQLNAARDVMMRRKR